jgi:hypothetical protein
MTTTGHRASAVVPSSRRAENTSPGIDLGSPSPSPSPWPSPCGLQRTFISPPDIAPPPCPTRPGDEGQGQKVRRPARNPNAWPGCGIRNERVAQCMMRHQATVVRHRKVMPSPAGVVSAECPRCRTSIDGCRSRCCPRAECVCRSPTVPRCEEPSHLRSAPSSCAYCRRNPSRSVTLARDQTPENAHLRIMKDKCGRHDSYHPSVPSSTGSFVPQLAFSFLLAAAVRLPPLPPDSVRACRHRIVHKLGGPSRRTCYVGVP